MANKRLLTKDLKNGLTVKSMYNDLTLFINHYPNGVGVSETSLKGYNKVNRSIGSINMEYEVLHSFSVVQVVTVNCARIIHGNQVATNGVVHVIDRVITAVSNTIQDVLEVEDDLSSLNVSDCFFITISRNVYIHSREGFLNGLVLWSPCSESFNHWLYEEPPTNPFSRDLTILHRIWYFSFLRSKID